eukprot:3676943-Amphidinium_carterae.1
MRDSTASQELFCVGAQDVTCGCAALLTTHDVLECFCWDMRAQSICHEGGACLHKATGTVSYTHLRAHETEADL